MKEPMSRGVLELLRLDGMLRKQVREYHRILLDYAEMIRREEEQMRSLTASIRYPWLDESLKIECRLLRRDTRSFIKKLKGHAKDIVDIIQDIRRRFRFYEPC